MARACSFQDVSDPEQIEIPPTRVRTACLQTESKCAVEAVPAVGRGARTAWHNVDLSDFNRPLIWGSFELFLDRAMKKLASQSNVESK